MNPIIYFAEGSPITSQERLIMDGLGYIFDDYSPTVLPASIGPGKKSGCLFAPARSGLRSRDIRYQPTAQRWIRLADDSRYWCGYWTAKAPGPADLQRNQIFDGHLVELSDGNKWTVPVARYIDGSSAFPSKLKRIGNKWEFGEILDQYKNIVKQAEKLLEQFLHAVGESDEDAPVIEFTIDAEINLGIRALAMNYMVSTAEVDLLGLLTDQNYRKIAFALIDEPGMKLIQDALEKKNTTDGIELSASGSQGAIKDTARP